MRNPCAEEGLHGRGAQTTSLKVAQEAQPKEASWSREAQSEYSRRRIPLEVEE